jgi:hypothetical protein
MKPCAPAELTVQAGRRARRLSARVEKVLAAHPHADLDTVRHTLIPSNVPTDGDIFHWRLTEAWIWGVGVNFPKESAFWRQNEFKDLDVWFVI